VLSATLTLATIAGLSRQSDDAAREMLRASHQPPPVFPHMGSRDVEDNVVPCCKLTMKVKFGDDLVVNNTFMKLRQATRPPSVTWQPRLHYRLMPEAEVSGDRYTLMMIDPDMYSPSHLHWLVVNIPGSFVDEGRIIKQWEPPAPWTGIHHYTFQLYRQQGQFELDDPEVMMNLPQHRDHFAFKDFAKHFHLMLVGKLAFKTQRALFGTNLASVA